MAHHTYSTDCIVLGDSVQGESNRFLVLFTRDLGLVHAVGKNLRGENSKLRYHLQNYTYAHVSLVRGKEVWRITGAHAYTNVYGALQGSRGKQLIAARVCSLLSRLLQGEEADPILFDMVVRGVNFLEETSLDTELIRDFEYMFVIRILARLGYVGDQEEFEPLLKESPFSLELLQLVATRRAKALSAINKALEASGL